MKVSELTGAKLAQWVALALGYKVERDGRELVVYLPTPAGVPHSFSKYGWRPDLKWEHGGPIIDLKKISVITVTNDAGIWLAMVDAFWEKGDGPTATHEARGDTPLIAAMRAFVASRFGEEVGDAT